MAASRGHSSALAFPGSRLLTEIAPPIMTRNGQDLSQSTKHPISEGCPLLPQTACLIGWLRKSVQGRLCWTQRALSASPALPQGPCLSISGAGLLFPPPARPSPGTCSVTDIPACPLPEPGWFWRPSALNCLPPFGPGAPWCSWPSHILSLTGPTTGCTFLRSDCPQWALKSRCGWSILHPLW